MERNLEKHSFCATHNVYGGDLFKDQNWEKGFYHFIKRAVAFYSMYVFDQLCYVLHYSWVLRGPS